MSLKRQLLVSFLVQGAGAASVLLATLWLGARLGPEVQGGFSRTKSEVEFLAAFAMFGLPQALFYYLKSGLLGARGAMRWVIGSAALALPIGGVYAISRHFEAGSAVWALLALAVSASVAHGQLRGLMLVRERTTWFNVVSAVPPVLMLAGVAVVILTAAAPGLSTWLVVFTLASGAAAWLAWSRLSAAVRSASSKSPGWRALTHYGLAAWLTAALSTAAILAMQRAVEAAEGGTALGRFTMAMTLTQVPLAPISYAAPLLFRRWMEQSGASASRRWGGRFFLALLGVAAVVALLSLRWPDLGLGERYAGVTLALAVLMVGGAAEAASRVLTVQASAIGTPWVAVRAEASRWVVLGIGWALLHRTAEGLLPWCAAWSAAAIGAALVFTWYGRASR